MSTSVEPDSSHSRVSEGHLAIRRRIAECPYGFIFNHVAWQFEGGKLKLSGSVPSFYLKQVLQELFRDIDQVKQVTNDVSVVNSTGLSSG